MSTTDLASGLASRRKTTRKTKAKTKPRKRVGRPPEEPPPKMCARILEWIADGQTLASFCRKPRTPATRTVEAWKDKDGQFRAAYARAREIGGQVIADRLRDIATEPLPKGLEKGEANAIVQHRRLIIDVDKWLLARWFPTAFGDRVALAGAEGAAPIKLSHEEAAREVAMLLATAAARKVQAQRKAEAEAVESEGNGQTRS